MPLPDPDLFGEHDAPAPHQQHSATSRAAAEVATRKRYTIKQGVLELLQVESLTDADIARRLEKPENTTRSARVSLVKGGLAQAVGVGMTPSGCAATLWRAVPGGAPPGVRQGPAVGSGPGRKAVSAGGRRQTQDTEDTAAEVGVLWSEVRDCRPRWMSQQQHQGVLKAAFENHPRDIIGGLRQALRDLRSMGGGR